MMRGCRMAARCCQGTVGRRRSHVCAAFRKKGQLRGKLPTAQQRVLDRMDRLPCETSYSSRIRSSCEPHHTSTMPKYWGYIWHRADVMQIAKRTS
jgi:hypothetical protein